MSQLGSLLVSFADVLKRSAPPYPYPSSFTVWNVRVILKTSEKETDFLENWGIKNFRQVPNQIVDLVIIFFFKKTIEEK